MSQEEEKETSGTAIDTSKRDAVPPTEVIKEELKPSKGGGRRDGFYILIIILLLLGGGYLGYLLSEKNKYINECQANVAALELEMEDLNEMMYDQGLDLGEDVKENLQKMMSVYDEMEKSNTDLNDSITAQKQRITEMLAELESVKGDKRHYMSKAYKLQKETETLRNIMKDYIRTIDSLNTANGVLTTSLAETMKDLDMVTTDRDKLVTENSDLTQTVNKGSKLVASGIVTAGIREKGSGSYKEMERANDCTHIRSCFDLAENTIAKAGNKTVYMRVLSPDGKVLSSSTSNTLNAENGETLLYSDKKAVNYQKQTINVCVFYKLAQEIDKGNYTAQIWCEGVMVGSDTFVLK